MSNRPGNMATMTLQERLLPSVELHEPREKVLFYLVVSYAHIFQDVLIRPHHVQGTGYIEGSLFIVRNRCPNDAFIYSAYETRPIARNRLRIGERPEHLDTKFRLRFAQNGFTCNFI